MATALDQSPSNPRGLPAYQFTNWQSVFQPQLAARLAPSSPATQGPTASGAPVSSIPMTGEQILAQRNSQRQSVINQNPLWKAFQPKPQQPTGLANVSEAGSSAEDAQSMFGNVQDPLVAGTPPPVPATPFTAQPAGTSTPQYGFRSLSTPYGTASVRFGGSRFAGGGSQLRF